MQVFCISFQYIIFLYHVTVSLKRLAGGLVNKVDLDSFLHDPLRRGIFDIKPHSRLFQVEIECIACHAKFEGQNRQSGARYKIVQHEAKKKHKNALRDLAIAANNIKSEACEGVRITGKKSDGFLGQLFDTLVRYWPHHKGGSQAFFIPEYAVVDSVATVAAIRVEHVKCSKVCEDESSSCKLCASLLRDRMLGQNVNKQN